MEYTKKMEDALTEALEASERVLGSGTHKTEQEKDEYIHRNVLRSLQEAFRDDEEA